MSLGRGRSSPGLSEPFPVLYLGVDHDGSTIRAWLVDAEGGRLAAGLGANLEEALAPCEEARGDRPVRALAALADGASLPLPGVPRDVALFAAALGGETGLVVHVDGHARLLGSDRGGRLQAVIREAALLPQARALADTPAGRRLADRLLQGQDLRSAVFDLADFPGPDPGVRGLLVAQARRLVEQARQARSRLLPGGRLPGSWSGELMEAPLRDLFQQEVFRHLPEIRWRPPLLPPVGGAVLLARATGPNPPREDPLRLLLRQRPALRSFLGRLRDAEESR